MKFLQYYLVPTKRRSEKDTANTRNVKKSEQGQSGRSIRKKHLHELRICGLKKIQNQPRRNKH
jgi:hypothetical protein